MDSNSKPVEMGKEYIVNITDNGSAGDGIARIDGLIIFVKDAKTGYRNVKIKISSVKDRFATADPVNMASIIYRTLPNSQIDQSM